MSRKHVVNLDLLNSSDTTISGAMSSNITSREVDVKEMDKATIHCSWGAGPVGTFQVEAQVSEKDSWFVLDSGSPWAVTGTDTEAQIILNELPFVKIRLKWVATSGSGTLSAFLNTKSVGA